MLKQVLKKFKDGPIFQIFQFPNPRPKTRGAGLWRGCQNEKRYWESKSDLASNILEASMVSFFIPIISFNHLRNHTIAKFGDNFAQPTSAEALYVHSVLIFPRCRLRHTGRLISIHTPAHAAVHATATDGFAGQALGQHQRLVGWQEARHSLVGMEGDGQDFLVFHLGSGRLTL